MLLYSAVLNGLVAPPLLVIIMIIANNDRVMGKHTNTRALNILGWLATALMIAASMAMIASAAAG